MLTIIYDPTSGKVVPDDFIQGWADDVVKVYKEVTDMHITVGSSVMIDATRVLIRKGKLDYKETIYQFKGLELGVDKNGRLPVWPGGFCDVYDDILEELVGIKE
jgi:hypothetical protein